MGPKSDRQLLVGHSGKLPIESPLEQLSAPSRPSAPLLLKEMDHGPMFIGSAWVAPPGLMFGAEIFEKLAVTQLAEDG